MKYSDEYIANFGKETGFISANIEKVIRLMDVLSFISNELDKDQSKLVLKGGTAINLIYTNLARLSVDIDLDYVGYLEKEKAMQDRPIIISAIDDFMEREEFKVSIKSRGSSILDSKIYDYTNAFGNKENIKIDLNMIDRIHILPTVLRKITYFNKELEVNTLSEEELFAMKISAFVDRYRPRDLYDVNYLKKHMDKMNKNILRKLTIFYLSLDGTLEINEKAFNKIEITRNSVKKELLPLLRKKENFHLEEVYKDVMYFVKDLLTLTENEKKYLIEFSKGNYDPYLLFDEKEAKRAEKHPMAKWRVHIINKNN